MKQPLDPEILEKIRKWTQRPDDSSRKKRITTDGVAEDAAPSVRDRPKDLDEIVGQENLVNQLRLICAGSNLRDVPMPHVLLGGPAGHGKTTLSNIIAQELGAEMIQANGMTLRRPNDLISILMKCSGSTVLFIDEIHAMSKRSMEVLYEALEDMTVSMVVGTDEETVSYTHELEDLVVVGATTMPGVLATPFRQRFGFHGTVEAYKVDELAEIVSRAWKRVGAKFWKNEPLEVAYRSKGVPRRALHLAERVLDYAAVVDTGDPDDGVTVSVKAGFTSKALELFGIDDLGLDQDDYRILNALCVTFGGRTVGLETLAQALDMDPRTLRETYEPYLAQQAYITRTKTGRMALPKAYEILK